MAHLRALRPMLEVNDVGETIAFYRDVLGFTCIGTFGDDPAKPSWCQVERDGIRLMFTHTEPHSHDDGEVHAHEPGMAGQLYFDVDDVDAMYESLRGSITRFAWEPQDFAHGMREFAFEDCNGYLLTFGAPVT